MARLAQLMRCWSQSHSWESKDYALLSTPEYTGVKRPLTPNVKRFRSLRNLEGAGHFQRAGESVGARVRFEDLAHSDFYGNNNYRRERAARSSEGAGV